MKASLKILALVLTSLLMQQVSAAVSVDSLNYPVWVERNQQTIPLSPGDRLLQGDIVQTGKSGRAWLAIEEGSVIKLGQSARFVIDQAEFEEKESQTILKAFFNVFKGAFRFTSKFFQSSRQAEHQVGFRVGAVTLGIRGTDIWGRSADNEDFVALLEGSIEISPDTDNSTLMEQPLTLYRKLKSQPADAPAPVAIEAVQSLAPETELSVEDGIAGINGEYALVLMSLSHPEYVAPSLAHFHSAGYPAKAVEIEVDGKDYARILLQGLVDRQAASNLAKRLEADFAIDGLWITTN